MLPMSAMSDAATRLRTLLISEIGELTDLKQVKIGHPKDTLESMEADLNNVNLFFYNVEYDGPADGTHEDPFFVRLYCLVTPVGAKPGDSGPSAGENDLRMIGAVMRVLHEQPVIMVSNGDGDPVAQLQVVPHSLDLDNLNHIWSTQVDTAYRLSVAYEMALLPVPLAKAVERAPLVGETGVRVVPGTRREPLPDDGFGIDTVAPQVPRTVVDTDPPGWLPHICFVDTSAQTLAYSRVVASSALPDDAALAIKVALAGKAGDNVKLVWETWNAGAGWVRVADSTEVALVSAIIDPESFFNPFDANRVADVDLPIDASGQALLHAERERTRPDGSSVTLRSNPLLVTVTGGAA